MAKYKLEYIWLDGYTPVPNLRGKTQIKEFDSFPSLGELPLWGVLATATMMATATLLRGVAMASDAGSTGGAHRDQGNPCVP